MKCLSVRQPWAWAIIHAGKDVENRSWPTKYRGKLVIHAGKGCKPSEYEFAAEDIARTIGRRPPPLDEIPRGCIVGTVELVDCVENSRSKWAQDDAVHWVVRDPIPCQTRPVKGMLGSSRSTRGWWCRRDGGSSGREGRGSSGFVLASPVPIPAFPNWGHWGQA